MSAGEYVAAWPHIRGIFEEQGAGNAVWVWCPNASTFESGQAAAFYPGDEWVDWVCGDGYNYFPDAGVSYESFEDKFEAVDAFARAHNKPAMAGEYAAQSMAPGERARWIDEARVALIERLTQLLAVNSFHSLTSDHDWRLTPEPDALAALRVMALDPWFDRREQL